MSNMKKSYEMELNEFLLFVKNEQDKNRELYEEFLKENPDYNEEENLKELEELCN